MRLADFILEQIEQILIEWETFARSLPSGSGLDKVELRDHAAELLRATAKDMKTQQSKLEKQKNFDEQGSSKESQEIDIASELHGTGRVTSGFGLIEVVAEYRALRASVLRLWWADNHKRNAVEIEDVFRFNQSIDQSLAVSIESYTEHVNKSQQIFLAVLGHDLRNPLNSLKMGATLLSREGKLETTAVPVVTQMIRSVNAMERMISDLIQFSGSVLGVAPELSKEKTDLKRLCQEVVNEIRFAFPNCTLNFDSLGDFEGNWDATRLRQMISNLLANAVQHGDKNSPAGIALRNEGSEVIVTVHNEGIPIPETELATIFDPLVRGSSPKMQENRRHGSIGLGLYIVKEVVTSHGGTITVKSAAQGGTQFEVHLPK